jgi:pimeloyl-ACP methyl ester carboxylesterase
MIGRKGLRQIERERKCHFPDLEKHLPDLAPRPLLMIHGTDDTYIKPDMAGKLFELAREPKEFWLVENAKHNLALQVAGEEYRQRVLRFFEKHLAEPPTDGAGPCDRIANVHKSGSGQLAPAL